MVSAVWRLSHLTLAIFSFLFLIVASITGVILAFDAVNEKVSNDFRSSHFNEITLAQTIPALKNNFDEILELTVDYNQFVIVEGFNDEGNDFKAIVDPVSGKIIGQPVEKSAFIQWVTSLHRSLFLHETGRFIVGFVSFLLFLITLTGCILIIKRQQSFKKFFGKIHRDFFAQYFHVAAGRILLIPILVIALTGTYLFLLRFDVISKPEITQVDIINKDGEEVLVENFTIFKNIKLKDVVKVEFPFTDDSEEYFKIKLKNKDLIVNQFNGKVLHEVNYDKTTVYEILSLDLHTGRTSIVWAIILGIASLNILAFIYSGFVITLRRKSTKVKNKWKPNEAEIIILVGSENGSTFHFAHKLHTQLLHKNIKSFFDVMNSYKYYPNATKIFLFTSTYGLGDAPNNAKKFIKLIQDIQQNKHLQYAVLGFGSTNYDDFCKFAKEVDAALKLHKNFTQFLPIHFVNNKSTNDFVKWIQILNNNSDYDLIENTTYYETKKPKLFDFKVLENQVLAENDTVFKLTLQCKKSFTSGDLLAIYPLNNSDERFYSIAKVDNNIQLIVKLHKFGKGSNFLYNQQKGSVIKAKIVNNSNFHIPKKSNHVIMIANGTGIAPFLGMIDENTANQNLYLYGGFRYKNEMTNFYDSKLKQYQQQNKLIKHTFSFSRVENGSYVMHLINNDADFFAEMLNNGGVVMICGSLAMQRDVEDTLHNICMNKLNKNITFFKENNQILTDCY